MSPFVLSYIPPLLPRTSEISTEFDVIVSFEVHMDGTKIKK